MKPDSTLTEKFNKLFQDGMLVFIHVGKWEMLQTIDQEKDLGLKAENIPTFAMPGKKKLFPDEIRLQFSRIEQRGRTYLRSNSHKFPIVDAHFVPHRKLVEVYDGLVKIKQEYDKAVTEFLANYEKYKAEMLTTHHEKRASLENCYPPIDTIKDRFRFEITMCEIAFPRKVKNVSIAQVRAQNLAVEKMQAQFELAQEQHRQKLNEQAESFVKEAVVALRGQVVETFQTIADKIGNKEVVTKTNIRSLRDIIDQFSSLDFFDDAEVKARLLEAKALVKNDVVYKDNADAVAKLNEVVGSVLTVARNASDIDTVTGEYFRRINLAPV
ncbi:MAG: DUF3150 domain-containing protein [Nitrosomonadaceae bacterium]|nr:DUF3150 domain-containing protein [Nitrosomonadaceae bacterium]